MRILILILFPLFSYSQLSIGILESVQRVSYDADAQAFFNRVTTAGGSLTGTEKNAVNQLVLDLKSYSLWTKIDAAYPMVGSSSVACAQNLKSSSFTLTFSGGWVYNSSGIVPNGSNTFANTFYNPNTNGLQNDAHLSYYSKTNSNGTEIEIGTQVGTVYSLLEIRTSGTTYPIINSAAFGSFADTDSRAFYLGNRTASNVMNGWRNNIKLVTYTGASSTPPNNNLYIGALNGNNYYTTKNCAYASIGKGFTDSEAANYYTAITTFQTALSRQN
jgi:hypothetical protein